MSVSDTMKKPRQTGGAFLHCPFPFQGNSICRSGLRAEHACEPVSERGEQLQPFGERASQMAFRSNCETSFRGIDLRAAFFSSARAGPDPHYCRGR